MKVFFIAAALLSSLSAHADQFRCRTSDQKFSLKVHVRGDAKAEGSFVMLLIDKTVKPGKQTIARLSGSESYFYEDTQSFVYAAEVPEDVTPGRNILGTKIGNVQSIKAIMTIDPETNEIVGTIILDLLNGNRRSASLPVCTWKE